MAARLGVDVGGTFTDLVAVREGRLVTAKVPSVPADQSVGVARAIEAVTAGGELSAADVATFAHGTTVATNALLERRGARTALLTTHGFRDVIEIGRQNRPSLYDLTLHSPPPLVPRGLRFTVVERMGPDGVVVPLDRGSLAAAVDELLQAHAQVPVEAVAVCLLFAFLHPQHERAVGEAVRAALPGVPVSLSHEVLPEFREFERTATTVADAYLAPRLSGYLSRLTERARDAGVPAPLVMQSSGGVADAALAADQPARFVLSGPAGGVVGATYVAGLSGFRDLLTFDMGGTSTDVAPVVGGRVQTTTEAVVAGVPLKLPMVDVHTVSAGGGSIAWVDEGGALRVGPHSAGADPGPAAYGHGGAEPTVTDANLVLGLLPDGGRLGGEVVLRRDLAEQALSRLGQRLGLSAEQTALGVVRVADAEMVRALRLISVERGLDPREFCLVAFGGAGGLHACALAAELGVRRVLVPRGSGVLSALGLAISDVRRDYVAAALGGTSVEAAFRRLEETARRDLDRPVIRRQADLRYHGQSFELTVDGDREEHLVAAFHAAHEQRHGYRMDDEPVELVAARVVATVAGDRPSLAEPPAGSGDPVAGRRRVLLDLDDARDVPVLHRTRMGAGSAVEGPAVVELPEATCLVRPGWSGRVDGVGTLVLEDVR